MKCDKLLDKYKNDLFKDMCTTEEDKIELEDLFNNLKNGIFYRRNNFNSHAAQFFDIDLLELEYIAYNETSEIIRNSARFVLIHRVAAAKEYLKKNNNLKTKFKIFISRIFIFFR